MINGSTSSVWVINSLQGKMLHNRCCTTEKWTVKILIWIIFFMQLRVPQLDGHFLNMPRNYPKGRTETCKFSVNWKFKILDYFHGYILAIQCSFKYECSVPVLQAFLFSENNLHPSLPVGKLTHAAHFLFSCSSGVLSCQRCKWMWFYGQPLQGLATVTERPWSLSFQRAGVPMQSVWAARTRH